MVSCRALLLIKLPRPIFFRRKYLMKTPLKSVVALFVAFSLLLPSVVYSSAADDELKFFVASDIHYRPPSSLGNIADNQTLPGDSLYAHTNTKGMLSYEADAIIEEFLKRFEESDADILLIPGDISEDGNWDEHLSIAGKLREFKQRTGKRIFLIPGNHDIRTSNSRGRLNLSDFLEVYADIGFDEALEKHGETASYTAELGGKYRLLAIDACIYREDGSQIGDSLLSWIEEQVATAKEDGKQLIGMVHHSVLEHFEIQSVGMNLLCLDNYREIAAKFADWGIKYCFTGHEHANDISSAVTKSGNVIYDVETCSLITYPNSYREVAFSDSSVKISTQNIDRIDVSLLPDGFTDAQKELIQTDFAKYSYNYFRAGFKSYAYMIPDATAKLAQKLNIEEGTQCYAVLGETIQVLCEAVKLPMYEISGTQAIDSVEEIAALAGITLEKSDYTNVLDVAAAIYAGHYAGDESLAYNSAEVTLLGRSIEAVLIYALLNIPAKDAELLLSRASLPPGVFKAGTAGYTLAAKTAYMKTAAGAIADEYIKLIANGIICDSSAPADLNVTLKPYGQNDSPDSPLDAISDFRYICEIILRFWTALFKGVFYYVFN